MGRKYTGAETIAPIEEAAKDKLLKIQKKQIVFVKPSHHVHKDVLKYFR